MNRHTLYQPLPPRLTQTLIFLNVVVGMVATTLLAQGHDTAAAYTALGAGIINQAIQVFVGQTPNPIHEQTTDSTLSNRRDFVREEKTGYGESGRTKGGAK